MKDASQETPKKNNQGKVAIIFCAISVLSAVGGIWATYYFLSNMRLLQNAYNVAHAKELFEGDLRLKKCLGENRYFELTAKPCKAVDGKEALCFATTGDFQRYRIFQGLCLK